MTSARRLIPSVLGRCAWLALGWLAAAGPAWAEQPLSPDERLEAIRHGLVQAALQGATQVQTATWIDAQGALREASSFRTGMQVRGVRVLSYMRDPQGQPQARLQLGATQDLVKTPASPQARAGDQRAAGSHAWLAADARASTGRAAAVATGAAARACADGSTGAAGAAGLRHLIGLRLQVERGWTVDEAPLAQELGRLVTDRWLQAADAAAGWRLVELPAEAGSAYLRQLTGTSLELLPWRAQLSLQPVSRPLTGLNAWNPFMSAPAPTARLQLSVYAPGQSGVWFEASAELAMTADAKSWGSPRLSAAAQSLAASLVQGWAHALSGKLACEPVRPDVTHVRGQEVHINVGALSGVRAGDEWLIAQRQRFPRQLLDPGVAAQTVLARVEQVSAHQARLQVLAGPAASVQANWQAWPTESP